MNTEGQKPQITASAEGQRPQYVTPVARVMSEAEVLSTFQVTAAGTHSWWAM